MSYISSLNLLNADSPAPENEQSFQDELSLWANAQFSFDTAPGSALEDKNDNLLEALSKLTQLVQPVSAQPPTHHLPRIAPAPGPVSGIQLLEAQQQLHGKKRPLEEEGMDDDKRRRNTAASARFRMKKKLREQALEKTSKELSENVDKLESRVKELEMEAKWLRALVLEKDPSLLDQKQA